MTFDELQFTRAVYRDVLETPGLFENDIPYWQSRCDTREDAEVYVAMKLFRIVVRRYRALINDDLALWRLIRVALRYVCWRDIACKCLDRCALVAAKPLVPAPSLN